MVCTTPVKARVSGKTAIQWITKRDFIEILSKLVRMRGLFGGIFPALRAHTSHSPLNNPLPNHPQVARGNQCYQFGCFLERPFVASLGETKLAFKNSEGTLHLGSDTGPTEYAGRPPLAPAPLSAWD